MRELASETAGGERERRLYNRDFWAWTQEQAGALRRRDFGVIDWDNLIEEVETLGRSEKSAWTTHCKNVISHLLKIEYSPAKGSIDHWAASPPCARFPTPALSACNAQRAALLSQPREQPALERQPIP